MSEGGRRLVRESAREVVVVVASILIAFALDAWWDSSIERAEEGALLEGLLSEFVENRAPLDLRISNHERLGRGGHALVDLLESVSAGSVTVPDSLLITLLITPTFDPTLGTLAEAQSSGRISLIQNVELRRRLSAWQGQWLDTREEEQLSLQLVQNELFPMLARSISLTGLMDEGGPWVNGTPTESLRRSSTTVPVTLGLLNFAKMRAIRSNRAAQELGGLRLSLESIITMLEEEVRR